MKVYFKQISKYGFDIYYIFLGEKVLGFLKMSKPLKHLENVSIYTNELSRPVMDETCKELDLSSLSQDFYSMVIKHLFEYRILM